MSSPKSANNQALQEMLSQKLTDSTARHSQIVVEDQKSIEFLLKEYDRMVEFRKIADDNYGKAFNLYIGIISAATAIVIPLIQSLNATNKTSVINIIIIALVVFGLVTFANISFLNVLGIQFERAILLIQDNFISRDGNVLNFLHFRTKKIGIKGMQIRSLIARAVTGGSPKSLVVILNSVLIAILVSKLGLEYNLLSSSSAFLSLVAVTLFAFSAMCHLFYTRFLYKAHSIEQASP